MNKKEIRKTGIKLIVSLALICLSAYALFCGSVICGIVKDSFMTVRAEETDDDEEEKTLVITVVESTEAEDIEENEIPLAAYSNTEERAGTRHALLAGLMLAGVIAYTAYFVSYDRKLDNLLLEAAEADYPAMTETRD
ncbi:MAG: hypothetical protein IJ130_03245 [Solobacterium sp.]|nr:hypothetical protein [Solobacterium sp.]